MVDEYNKAISRRERKEYGRSTKFSEDDKYVNEKKKKYLNTIWFFCRYLWLVSRHTIPYICPCTTNIGCNMSEKDLLLIQNEH